MADSTYTGTDNLEVMREAVKYNRWLIDLVKKRARIGDQLLDFGAGVGTFAVALAGAGYRVICVEPDAAQRSTITKHGLTAHADLTPIGDETIDFAYTYNVLEHIEDDRAALAEIARKIRRGGKLLIYVPAFDVLCGRSRPPEQDSYMRSIEELAERLDESLDATPRRATQETRP